MSTHRRPRHRTRVFTVVPLLAVALLVPAGGAPAEEPTDGNHWFDGHQYTVVEEPLSWHDAADFCSDAAGFGGHLVTINSEAENQFVFELYPFGWLGATDTDVEGEWHWVTDEPFDYTNWAPGEPNDFMNEDYLMFANDDSGLTIPEWNDVPGGSAGFVCEWEEPVVPYRVDALTVAMGDTVTFGARWLAVCTRGLTAAWTHAADVSWTLDGSPLAMGGSWIEPFPSEKTAEFYDYCFSRSSKLWNTFWIGSYTFDAAGTYEIGMIYSVSHKIHWGGDYDGDGKLDFVEPGVLSDSSVTVHVVE